ncbi:CASTOR/POLLUX-related putative ion channel [Streptomyces avermitilis]|uniref:CASTOR/POLLUX-related putative ion channel n=1 Tax=Streptomyces avermitilis TaxID=33903 RepID=UPI0036808B74
MAKHMVAVGGRARYWFDSVVARGTPALIGWLALVCLAVVVPASAGLVWADRHSPTSASGRLTAVWKTVGQTLKIGGEVGPPVYVLLSVLLAMVALLFVSALVGLITTGMSERIMALRLGRSLVIEERHTVLLGWSDQVFPLISELVAANANRRGAVVAVLSEMDKPEMEDQINTQVGRGYTTRIICRNGSVTDPAELARVSPHTARAVLIPSPRGEGGDALVIKTLLALDAAVPDRGSTTVVAAVRDTRHHAAASLAAGRGGRVLNIDDITARLIVQTSRQPGLSLVYQELLDFAGNEFYTVAEPALADRPFGEALLAYATSSVVGLLHPDDTVELNPPMERPIAADDRLVLITEDDDTAFRADGPLPVDENVIATALSRQPSTARLLMLGWNRRASMIVTQLDAYVSKGSRLDIVSPESESTAQTVQTVQDCGARTRHLDISLHNGDTTEPRILHDLDIPSYDAVIVLGYDGPGPTEAAGPDDRTLVTLLHLRALEQATGRELPLVTEMHDDRNRLLAPVRDGADFIVSGRLISLLMTQIAENRHLATLFDDLFTAHGNGIHLKPATDYVRSGHEATFATVVESARRRRHCAIGYRLASGAATGPAYGVHINPDKRERIQLGDGDCVIVVAENQPPLPTAELAPDSATEAGRLAGPRIPPAP